MGVCVCVCFGWGGCLCVCVCLVCVCVLWRGMWVGVYVCLGRGRWGVCVSHMCVSCMGVCVCV